MEELCPCRIADKGHYILYISSICYCYVAESCCPMSALYNICPVTPLHQEVQSGSLIEHRLLSVCLHGAGDTNDTGTNAASQEAGPCPFIKSTRYLIISRDSEFCSLSIILHLNLMSICSSVLAAADQVVCVDSVVVFVSTIYYLLSNGSHYLRSVTLNTSHAS